VSDAPGVGDDAAGLRAANARLKELLAERDAQLAAQAAAAVELREQVAGLQAQVAELAARLGQNSLAAAVLGRPGEAGPEVAAEEDRPQARPECQPGATMQLSDCPDHVVRHEPARCCRCARDLAGAAEAGVIRRQVTEIPPVKAEVTEHRLIGRACGCGTVTWGEAPAGVTAPVQYGPRAAALGVYLWHGQFLPRDRARAAMADMFGCAPSPGALAAMSRKIAGVTAPALDAVTGVLAAAGAAHFDETGFRVAGKLAWVHSASSGKYVLVTVHARRGRAGMEAAGVLHSNVL
jgi:transposase